MNHRRRILAALLAASMLLPLPALAEGEVRFTVATVDGAPGGEIALAVEIADCDGVDSAQFHINYDPSALAVKRIEPGTAFPAEYCVANAAEAGRIRVACASATGISAEDGGAVLTVTFALQGAAGSSVTLSDVIVTAVDSEYNQTRAYVSVENGGVTVGGAALPAPLTTPWIAETPVPTPSPTPTPTSEPTAMIIGDTEPAATPEPVEPEPAATPMLPYLIVGIFAVLAAAAIVIILITSGKQSKRRKKRRKKKSGGGAKRRRA